VNIGLYHGYNLTGSGSNEFTRYLAKTFLEQGHTVHIICREYHPEKLGFIGRLWQWKRDGKCVETVLNPQFEQTCTLHQIPYGDFYPVYISGKQRSDTFKAFVDLTDQELAEFKQLNEQLLTRIFSRIHIDILHTNHLVMQPSFAINPCQAHDIPFIIYPHGSAIEYTVKKDQRYLLEARKAIRACRGLVIGNHEVTNRICDLFPNLEEMILAKTEIVGVGVDTQLFSPVERERRTERINSFLQSNSLGGADGKSPHLVTELHIALRNRQFSNIGSYDDRYTHNQVDTDVKQKLISISFSDPVLLFVGALTVGKGLQTLICALPEIYKSYPNMQLLIVGAGSFREVLEALIYALANSDHELLSCVIENRFDTKRTAESSYWQDVIYFLKHINNRDEYFTRAKRLLKQVKFLGRFNHEQLSYLFPCADLAVFPSVVPEAYPLVLMESLANGVLPVVSYFSGFKDGIDDLAQYLSEDLIENMKIPMIIESRISSLVLQITTLLNKLKAADVNCQLAEIAKDQYDWSHRAQQLVAAYQRLIN